MLIGSNNQQSDPVVGRVFRDEYRIESELGAGGMSRVYRAHQLSVDRPVVVKVMTPPAQRAEEWRARFMQEARVASKVRHPGIVTIYSFGEEPGVGPYIAMEFVDGLSLRELLRDEVRLAPARACMLMAQVCRAMHAAHEATVVHRDLKPDNIMVEVRDEAEVARVLDFGIAKPADSVVNTLDEHVVGTPEYMAPEQARKGAVDLRADVYAAGIIIFELLVGERPFAAAEPLQLMFKHVAEPFPFDRLDDDLPAALVDLLRCACAKAPDDRYPDARSMARALEEIAADLGGAAARRSEAELAEPSPAIGIDEPAPPTLVGPVSRTRPSWLPWGVGLLLVIGTWALISRQPEPTEVPEPLPTAPVAPVIIEVARPAPALKPPVDRVPSEAARWTIRAALAGARGVAEGIGRPRKVEASKKSTPPVDDFHRVEIPTDRAPEVLSPTFED